MPSFQVEWSRFHPNTHPLGHMLHYEGNWNMTRFHLLSGGRKQAASHDEVRDLLERYNAVATATLGENAPCYLVALQSPNQDKKHRLRMDRLKKRYRMTSDWEFFSTSDAMTYTVWTGDVVWTNNGFNRLLLHTYQTDFWDLLWVNKDNGAVFRPYDAGADISQPTPEALVERISSFYGWMPQNGNGFITFNQAQMKNPRFQVTKPCAEAMQKVIAAQKK
ncbi:MAG: hypothetical protein WBQ60_08315 [Asticcacaulis sp.]